MLEENYVKLVTSLTGIVTGTKLTFFFNRKHLFFVVDVYHPS
jgi:hypothetical protein